MGGAVVSLMDWKHERSLVPHVEIQRSMNYGPFSVPVPNTETATSSSIYRTGKFPSDAQLKEWQNKTYNGPNQTKRFTDLCRAKGGRDAIAYRRVERVAMEDVPVGPSGEVKRLEVSYMTERKTMTYGKLLEYTENVSRGLAELGLNPRDIISIYEETRWEWLATIYGIWLQNMIASTVYANLGEDALFYALKETECKAIVCNGKSVPNLLRGVAAGSFDPCVIVYFDDLPADAVTPETNPKDCRVVSWQEVVKLGAAAKGKRKAEPPTNNDDIALIMYTSGTTGDPKGVMHSHGSLTAGILIMDNWLWSCTDRQKTDTYCSYLPLAHILEFGVVNIFLAGETLVGFGSPRTLTDMTARPNGDLTEYKPTLMIGVPRIFDTLRSAVQAKLPPKGSFKRNIFDNAYAKRLQALKEGKETPFYNKKVFQQAREAIGGRMRLMLSGGGPLAAPTQEFVNVVFCPMVIGWGLTETVCVGAIQVIGDLDLGVAGQVLAAEELKLADTEDYKHTDKPEPRGELCLRGPFLFKGYYKQPELTAEAIDKDGWFHTGDIGCVDDKQRIRLVGRVKALAKNVLGEYIAMEALEAIYTHSPLVLNSCVCVLVHPARNYICAIAITDQNKAVQFAKENGITVPMKDKDGVVNGHVVSSKDKDKGSKISSSSNNNNNNTKGDVEKMEVDMPTLLRDRKFRKRAAESMAELAVQNRRKRFECVRNVLLVTDDWTPENGLLTAAMKLKRSMIDAKYKDEIEEMFSENTQ